MRAPIPASACQIPAATFNLSVNKASVDLVQTPDIHLGEAVAVYVARADARADYKAHSWKLLGPARALMVHD